MAWGGLAAARCSAFSSPPSPAASALRSSSVARLRNTQKRWAPVAVSPFSGTHQSQAPVSHMQGPPPHAMRPHPPMGQTHGPPPHVRATCPRCCLASHCVSFRPARAPLIAHFGSAGTWTAPAPPRIAAPSSCWTAPTPRASSATATQTRAGTAHTRAQACTLSKGRWGQRQRKVKPGGCEERGALVCAVVDLGAWAARLRWCASTWGRGGGAAEGCTCFLAEDQGTQGCCQRTPTRSPVSH